ncbi:uncharacterized protein LOC108034454 [Drosophila biarmipes]|uniref:uncharacterized protein LOC108034454 n=1 Tax=Drosophila biarmipes TaxID=125945 RepID=UPI001CDAF28E|nr:uncharacterized protein LOC108034454 [Drosophila biarmipes]
MGTKGRSAKSVSNFATFLLIFLAQNCGTARSHGRDGLAKLEFSGPVLPVFNFAKIYETLCAQLPLPLTTTPPSRHPGEVEGRELVRGKPMFHVFDQLQHDFEAKWRRTTTAKPFSILQHLGWEQEQEAQRLQAHPNTSFHVLQQLYKDQKAYELKTTTVKPFLVLQELEKDYIKANKHTTTVKPFHIVGTLVEDLIKKDLKEGYLVEKPIKSSDALAEHKAELKPESRAKQSQKRRRKRIRRRRKRIRRRRKRTRRRRRKKRKKRRKKRKRKKHKGDKKKKKKGKRKKRKKQQKPEEHDQHSIFQPGQVIFANPTKSPHYHHPHGYPYPPANQVPVQTIPTALLDALITTTTTTKKPKTTTTTFRPLSKIKYLLRHNSIFKKKKKEYMSHVGQVLYPFVKFVAFFTVLNPFTLGVFLFTLISPAVFGFLGFVALSVLVKPFLHLVFGVKRNVNAFEHKRWLAHKQEEKLKLALRPVTIHKHFYQQNPVHSAPPVKLRPVGHWRRQGGGQGNEMLSSQPPPQRPPPLRPPPKRPPLEPPPGYRYNPLLPDDRKALEYDNSDQPGIFL